MSIKMQKKKFLLGQSAEFFSLLLKGPTILYEQ